MISSKVVVQPEDSVRSVDSGPSVLESPKSYDDAPQTRLQKMEIGEIEESAGDSAADASDEALELSAPSPEDTQPLPQPTIDADEAGWRIRWNPVYAREV